jgi:signal peptidase II
MAALIAAGDQALKYYIVTNYQVWAKVHDVMPGLFSFTYVQNNGAAWNVSVRADVVLLS